ncbi:MAG: hypothetical protein M1817_004805 [Caeruleum heppii]|nr:MAG: hypothetical protein M1817_004805 [Caeruleum heppii]
MSREEYEHDRDEVLEEDRDHTLRALEGRQIESSLKPDHPQYQQKEDTNGVESDLFLTLANTDSEPPAESRLEQMKSRLANKRQSLPADSFSSWRNPAPLLRETTDPDLRPRTQPATHSRRISQNISANYRSSIPSPSASRSAHPAEDTGKGRYLEGTSRTSFNPSISSHLDRTPSLSGGSERRPSLPVLTPNTPSRTYRQSNLSHAIPPDHPSHLTAERHANTQLRPTVPYPDDTESTVSTTAASTVWDELDSLKSRMRRLELTGRLPDSSDAAMTRAANDRPHTATTTVTTVSSSPRRGRMSPKASEASTAMGEANGPPLLQALQESKALLEPNVYGALEATAADALSLAAMVSSNHAGANLSSAASTIGMNTTNPVSDRQVRRKAESVCRSLTEFCVALAGSPNLGSPGAALHLQPNHGSPTISVAPRSPLLNDGMSDISPVQGYNTRRRGSAQSDALSIARSGSRALSRVEARRSSMMSFSNAPSPRTPQESSIPMSAASVGNSGAATPLTHMNLLKRTSTMLRSRRGVGVGDSSPLDDEAFSSRAPSRAATEIGIGHLRRGHGTGSPREYTSSHPLPHLPPSQPSQTPSHLAYQSPTPASLLRRPNHISTSIGTPSSNTPNTVATATSRRFLERSSPASSSVERNEGISLNGSKARNPSFGRIAVGLGRR